jgi:hypothetical protein
VQQPARSLDEIGARILLPSGGITSSVASSLTTDRVILRGHCRACKPYVKEEVRLVNKRLTSSSSLLLQHPRAKLKLPE